MNFIGKKYAHLVCFTDFTKGSDIMNVRLNALNNYTNAGKITGVNKSSSASSSKETASAMQEKNDVITISSRASDYSEVAKIQTSISSEVNSLGSDGRVSALKEAVARGEYNVSSYDIAGSILSRFA